MIDPADQMLLASVRQGLAVPFRDPVRVAGQLMPRRLARQIERNLLRLKIHERSALPSKGADAPRRGSLPSLTAPAGFSDPFHISGGNRA